MRKLLHFDIAIFPFSTFSSRLVLALALSNTKHEIPQEGIIQKVFPVL